jgi:hypothetical protein
VRRLLLLLHVICGGGTFIDDGASSPGELLHGPVAVAAAAFRVDLQNQPIEKESQRLKKQKKCVVTFLLSIMCAYYKYYNRFYINNLVLELPVDFSQLTLLHMA